MRFPTLEAWLRWQEQLHPSSIDLGLERVTQVLQRMGLPQPPFPALTIAGTNGKGSCVALLEAILRAAGYRVGAYTSPHLLRYNERICINGVAVSDADLCAAFENVDQARGRVSLTYFEFGTLAAFDIFRRCGIEAAVLEVGMGGRLDAVNAIDPLGALVSSIDLDHQEWLGKDRDSIGYEKAGVYRHQGVAICSDRQPPSGLLQSARQMQADLQVLGRDFDCDRTANGWDWRGRPGSMLGLPLPALPGRIQLDNASGCIALLGAVAKHLPVNEAAIRTGLETAVLPARFEQRPGTVSRVLDVAHNPAAARVLAMNLVAHPVPGKSVAVVGMFRDKAVETVAASLAGQFDAWYVGGLDGPRGQSAADLARRIHSALPDARLVEEPSIAQAFRAAQEAATAGDRIVVFGSFQTVATILRLERESGTNGD